MRRACVLAAVLFAVVATRADDKPEAKPDPDLKKLQGKWRISYHESVGVDDTQDCIWEMEVRGDRFTLTADGTTTTGRIRLDSTKKPKELEYTVEDSDTDEVTTFVGLYELEGDTYKTCDVEKGKDAHPTEFKTKARTGQVAVWKKVKVKVRD
jgi:uncharacterized protein (TIGR03067 family)